MDDPLSWIIIGLCILGSFIFSASETAIACCNRFKISVMADDGNFIAKVLLKILDKYDRSLMTVLIGLNVMTIVASTLSTLVFYNMLLSTNLGPYYSVISTAVITIAIYILGDTLPKTIARAIPDTISLVFALPLYGLMFILTPITILFELMAKSIEKMFKVKTDDTFTEEDFENIVDKSSDEEGPLEEEQTDIMQSALEFDETNVLEVYTPKDKIFAIDIHGLTHEKLNEIIIDCEYSRIPVYDRVFDNIIGVLVIKNYLAKYFENKNCSIRKLLQKPYFIRKNAMIDDIFRGFKRRRTHIALIRENNKILGMVTMEDVLEELVPDIGEPHFIKRRRA